MVKLVKVKENCLARAFSFGPFKRIYLGRKYFRLPNRYREAVVSHEIGHIVHRDTEKRMICAIFAPWRLKMMCRMQEFAADRYAASYGYANELIKVLSSQYDGGPFHPSHEARRKMLEKYGQSRSVPVKDQPRTVGVTD